MTDFIGSKAPCLTRVTCQQDGFKSCDFWVAGISPTVFSLVSRDVSIWTALLQATYGWEDVYKTNPDGKADKTEEYVRRSMNPPGTAKDKHYWEHWVSTDGVLSAYCRSEEPYQGLRRRYEVSEVDANLGEPSSGALTESV